MERFEGYTSLTDVVRDEYIANWIGFQLTADSVVFMIGGTQLRSRPVLVTSDNIVVIRLLRRVVQVLRSEAHKQRKIVPVPKPAKRTAPKRDNGICERCDGLGEYEWGDGEWRRCPVCNPAKGDGDGQV